MTKQKIKLSLVDDYIKVINTLNFCANYILYGAKEDKSTLMWVKALAQEMKNSYDKLLFKYNYMDVSLLVLKKELNQAEDVIKQYKEKTLIYNKNALLKCKQEVENLYSTLQDKLKKLSLNEIEQRYIIQDVSKTINNPICLYV